MYCSTSSNSTNGRFILWVVFGGVRVFVFGGVTFFCYFFFLFMLLFESICFVFGQIFVFGALSSRVFSVACC